MRAKVIASVVVALVLMLCAIPVYGQEEIPPLPHAFYGTVKINDSPASAGTQIEARGEGVRTGIEGNSLVTTAAGNYGSADPMGSKLIVQGDIQDGATLTFYVDGVSTGQTAEWHSGGVAELNLTVTIPRPPTVGGGGGGAPDITPPRISDILLSGINETSANISWITQELSDSQLEYWSSPSQFSPLDAEMVIHHLVHLADLSPGTIYYFRAMSKDGAGNLGVSDEHTFTTLGEAPIAAFACASLHISPGEVNTGETVAISVLVTNTGGADGICEVVLRINGEVEATKKVTINAGASEEVTFTTMKDVAGSYLVEVRELSGSFTVKEKPVPLPSPAPPSPAPSPAPSPTPSPAPVINWLLLWGIIGGVILVGAVIFLVATKRGTSR